MAAIIIIPVYLLFCVWLAKNNAERIAENKTIHHFLNGLLHLSAAILLNFLKGWQSALALLLLVRTVFDISLNHFRNLPPFHTTLKPKSVVDKIEKWVFSNSFTAKVMYVVVAIFLLLNKF